MLSSKRKTTKRVVAAIMVPVLLSVTGCVSLKPKDTAFGPKIDSYLLYMNIKKHSDNRYYVAGFSSNSGLVRVNDLSAAIDTRSEKCGVGSLWGLGRQDYKQTGFCASSESTFRKRRVDVGGTALSYVLSMGIFAAFGIYLPYGYFDDGAYKEAVASALKNSQIDREALLRTYGELVKNRDILKRYVTHFSEIRSPRTSLELGAVSFESHEELKKLLQEESAFVSNYLALKPVYDEFTAEMAMFNNLRDKYQSAYLRDLEKIEMSPRIIDKSGFYRKDADLSNAIAIAPNKIKAISDLTGASGPGPDLSLAYVKFVTPEELTDILAKLKEYGPHYEEYLRNTTSSYQVVGSGTFSQGSYQMLINAPKTMERGSAKNMQYEVVILGKDFENVYPSLSANDGTLFLQFKDHELVLTNKAKSFLSISSISVYFNGDVATTQQSIELPPQTELSRPISLDSLTSAKIKYGNVYKKATADMARKDSVRFGFAIKYRLAGQAEKTFYQVKDFNLYDALIAQK